METAKQITENQDLSPRLCAVAYAYDGGFFYFGDMDEHEAEYDKTRFEEYEYQFINGGDIACELFSVLKVDGGSLHTFFECLDVLTDSELTTVLIRGTVEGVPYGLDCAVDIHNWAEDAIIHSGDKKTVAETLIDEDEEIPEHIKWFIDVELYARDVLMDWYEVDILGESYCVLSS